MENLEKKKYYSNKNYNQVQENYIHELLSLDFAEEDFPCMKFIYLCFLVIFNLL